MSRGQGKGWRPWNWFGRSRKFRQFESPARPLRLERLEDRSLLATLWGTVYNDFNGNGIKDSGDITQNATVSGWMVYAVGPTGAINANHATDYNGGFTITVPDNTGGSAAVLYKLHAYRDASTWQRLWMVTAPSPSTSSDGHLWAQIDTSNTITYPSGQDFGLHERVVQGSVFNDVNNNGVRDAGDVTQGPSVAGWSVYVHDRFGRPIASQSTDARGNFSIALPNTFDMPIGSTSYPLSPNTVGGGAAAGPWSFTLGVTPKSGWNTTAPGTTNVDATFTVQIDSGGNLVLDSSGNMVGAPKGLNFGNHFTGVQGVVFNDFSKVGKQDSSNVTQGTTVSSWTISATNSSSVVVASAHPDPDGFYTLQGANGAALPAGQYTVSESLLDANNNALTSGSTVTFPDPTADPAHTYLVTVDANGNATYKISTSLTTTPSASFGNFYNGIQGSVFKDVNQNGALDAPDETLGADLAGWTIQAQNTTTLVSYFANTTGPNGAFTFTQPDGSALPDGTYTVVEFARTGWIPTAPAADTSGNRGFSVTITGGVADLTTAVQFGNYEKTITGNVWVDVNGSSTSSTALRAGWTVFADLNGNGVPDAGEPSVRTGSDGTFTLALETNQTSQTLYISELPRGGWTQTAPAVNTDILTVNQTLSATLNPRSYKIAVAADGTITGGPASGSYDFGNQILKAVTGKVWNDLDGNGGRSTTDTPLSGWTVYADLNNNGVLDPGEPSAVSNSSGNYSLLLATGDPSTKYSTAPLFLQGTGAKSTYVYNYVLREQLQTGWVQTAPAVNTVVNARVYVVTLADDGTLVGAPPSGSFDFGNNNLAITGQVSYSSTHTGTSSVQVFDANDKVVASATSDGLGAYSMTLATKQPDGSYNPLPAGTYTISEVPQPGWILTAPSTTTYTFTVRTNGAVDATKFALNFSNDSATTGVRGRVWDDLNGDGIMDNSTEVGLSGWVVQAYAVNADNTLTLAKSATSDVTGNYRLTGLSGPTGTATTATYVLLESGPSGWTETAPAPNPNAGNQRWYIFTIDGSGNVSSTPASGLLNFGDRKGVTVSVSGKVAYDALGNGTSSVGLPHQLVYAVNASDSSVYTATTDSSGAYTLSLPTPSSGSSTFVLRDLLPAGWQLTVPGVNSLVGVPAYVLTVSSTGSVSGNPSVASYNFASNDDGAISGSVWLDDSGASGPAHATLETSRGLQGWTVFIDTNGNGTYNSGEPTATTDANGNYAFGALAPGRYSIGLVKKSGWSLTYLDPGTTLDYGYLVTVAPGTGSHTRCDFGESYQGGLVRGTVWVNQNSDGVQDSTEPSVANAMVFADLNGNGKLDPNEPSTHTASDGSYSFFLPGGQYAIYEVPPLTGYSPANTLPANGANYPARVYSGSYLADRSFQNVPAMGTLTGQVFNDINANGKLDPAYNEGGIGSATVYAVSTADPTKIYSATTGTDGKYTLRAPAGTYTVKIQQYTAYNVTSPYNTGGAYSNVVFTNGVVAADAKDFALHSNKVTITYNTPARDLKTSGGTGYVMVDLNGNGAEDSNDFFLATPCLVIATYTDPTTKKSTQITTHSDIYGRYTLVVPENTPCTIQAVLAGWIMTTALPSTTVPGTLGGQSIAGPDLLMFRKPVLTGHVVNNAGIVNPIKTANDPYYLANWTIQVALANNTSVIVSQTTTDSQGNYKVDFPSANGPVYGTSYVITAAPPTNSPLIGKITLPAAFTDAVFDSSNVGHDFSFAHV